MPIAAECRLEWWEIFINTASLSIVVYAGIFFCRLPFFTWKRLGWFGVDVKRSGIFIQFLNSWTIFEKLMSRKLWRKFCEETNSVNFNSSERFTKNKTKISNFPVCITWLRFPETFMKQLNSTRRLFENSWKIKSFGKKIFCKLRHPCCAPPDTRPTRTIHFPPSNANEISLFSLEWRLVQLEEL